MVGNFRLSRICPSFQLFPRSMFLSFFCPLSRARNAVALRRRDSYSYYKTICGMLISPSVFPVFQFVCVCTRSDRYSERPGFRDNIARILSHIGYRYARVLTGAIVSRDAGVGSQTTFMLSNGNRISSMPRNLTRIRANRVQHP